MFVSVKIGLREQAAGLAEKFSDFDILIQICDQTNDDVRLQKYLHDEDFVEQVGLLYVDFSAKPQLSFSNQTIIKIY